MIKILHVIGSMNMGGTEMILMNLYKNIDRNRVQFDFAIHTDESCFFENEIKKMGGQLYRFKRFDGKNFKVYKKQWENFFDYHKEHQIVHGHIGSCAYLYLSMAKKYGKITIAHSHSVRKTGDFSIHNILWSIYSYPTRFIADYFMGCSYKAGKDRYGKKVANSDRFQVLKNGIESKKFQYNENDRNIIRSELGIDNSSIVIGHVGRMVKQKNHSFLIDIFNEYQKINDDSYLVLVGDGNLIKKIKDKVFSLNLENKIFFMGTRKDTQKFLSAFDYFVFPSINEGLGIAVIEAQASGLPTLCSNALPPEAKVSSNIEFFSLKENAKKWSRKLYNLSPVKSRENAYLDLSNYDYDILNVVDRITQFYHTIVAKELQK